MAKRTRRYRYWRPALEAEAIATATAIAPPHSTTTPTTAATIKITARTVRSVAAHANGDWLVLDPLPIEPPVELPAVWYWSKTHRAPQCGQRVPFASVSDTCRWQLEQIGTR